METETTVLREALACGLRDWGEIWGDPLVSGTIFMLAYGGTGILLLNTARRLSGRVRTLWIFCGILFLFQVLNTHLDLHAFIVTFGRCLSHAQGWYEDRRVVQLAMLAGLVGVVIMLLYLFVSIFQRDLGGNLLLVVGVGIALGMTVLKGINYHGLEPLYSGTYGPFRGADLVEFFGIFVALLAALLRRRRLSRGKRRA